MKIVFAGSPEYAVPALEAVNEKFGVTAVITQPDKPVGRKRALTPTPVKARAVALGIEVYDFDKIRAHAKEVKNIGADIMVTCAYGQLLTRDILDSFPQGVWNLHASLLPKFRGASPIQSAILAGVTHTGVTVMRTELSLDTGDILLVKRCEAGGMTCGELSEKLSLISAQAAVEAVEMIAKGNPALLLQDEAKATYCKKITKDDAKIDFGNSPEHICGLINAMNPQPMAYCLLNGNVLNVLRAEPCGMQGEKGAVICADKRGFVVGCASGSIIVKEILPAGGKKMRACDFVNGRKIKAGDKLD